MSACDQNPFLHLLEPLDPQKPGQKFYNLSKLGDARYGVCVCVCVNVRE